MITGAGLFGHPHLASDAREGTMARLALVIHTPTATPVASREIAANIVSLPARVVPENVEKFPEACQERDLCLTRGPGARPGTNWPDNQRSK